MTEICQIASNSSDKYKKLLAKIKEMEKFMINVRGKLITMQKVICAGFGQGNEYLTYASVSLDNFSVAVSSIIRIPPGIASEISCKNKNKVLSTTCKDRENSRMQAVTNAPRRQAARETEHFDHCIIAYVLNKDVIDALIKRNCSRLMIKSAISEGESEDEFPERPCKRILKFNNIIFNIDEIVRANLGNSICQLLDRNLISLSEKPVPDDFDGKGVEPQISTPSFSCDLSPSKGSQLTNANTC
ncbi:hypothetical protein PHYBLDRAFT_142967 [Phycomyces blakesleeanus NRRL 1555(-)]|uniref:Uncharacterized protein n=1 Tax=Phycomyces blakesleeanus (strain ATCC 8743b / DSM 1359 / FGSC 10004 / NBRC 33097 / NRRL 1555) TaxID=763407 RepID=A0A163AUW8_PHYB8|nr:hypothetical protein PHYBLDRAFT_153260 [Phycomyces blakesleeanus NRRL 1555(-)]XP_018294021.1 hypothetical protein PHYBLDRAFT_142967 [Phycomyces blakesleeanus NRRL 1555(-)]OAD65567.1 hypothetical protein PHYBLDRAFT_153260 [Phycomyces blakesleeanus NRRL 1555(-)]OAD75981.1 hypothetical protein PHYBLDRAFT_142967 [Phycomyces blakesleeanus NRRL 1555(-)]|eukprot:XP_018283607.1 hypothetical protein PHYBLDRAFT_153260 [Phycomyces blakesleeanus NRRL 1555(-)]